MAHDYLVYRINTALHTLQVLRQTLERRFAKDSAVDAKVDELEADIRALIQLCELE